MTAREMLEPVAAYLAIGGGAYTAFLAFTASADVSQRDHFLLTAAGAAMVLCGYRLYTDRRHSVVWSIPVLLISALALYGLYIIYNDTFVCCVNIFVFVALGPIVGLIAGFLGVTAKHTPSLPTR